MNIENKFHRSSCVETYFQCNVQTTENNMLLELLSQILNEPCQNILRTKEQLGYIVFSGIRRASGVQGLRIIVQSDKHPQFVDQRIEAFLVTMSDYIRNLSQEEFLRHREALAAHRLEKPKRLGARTARYWLEINSQQYNFDRANIEVAFLKTLTSEDIIEFFKNMISANSPVRRKLAVHVLSMAEGGAGSAERDASDGLVDEEKPTVIEDITKFKSSQGLFPLAQPFISINSSSTKSKL